MGREAAECKQRNSKGREGQMSCVRRKHLSVRGRGCLKKGQVRGGQSSVRRVAEWAVRCIRV